MRDGMNDQLLAEWVRTTAARLPYPPAPPLPRPAARVRWTVAQRRAAALALLLLLMASLLAVPQVRAAVRQFLRLGAIGIFVDPPPATVDEPAGGPPAAAINLPADVAALVRPVTPAEAQARLRFALQRPNYPADLGSFDQLLLDEAGETAVMLWLAGDPAAIRLALYQIGATDYAFKQAEWWQETTVGDEWGLWLRGAHQFRRAGGDPATWQFVAGNVLIWQSAGVTYRLESGLDLDEARRVAESLAPLNLTDLED